MATPCLLLLILYSQARLGLAARLVHEESRTSWGALDLDLAEGLAVTISSRSLNQTSRNLLDLFLQCKADILTLVVL